MHVYTYLCMNDYMYESVFLELKSDIILMQLSIKISIFIKNEVRSILILLIKVHDKYFSH